MRFGPLVPGMPILALVLGASISGCKERVEQSCASPAEASEIQTCDANGDGSVDIADGMWIQRWAYGGGPAPVCYEAVDLFEYDQVGTEASANLWSYLFTGVTKELPVLPAGACESRNDVGAPPPCGQVQLSVSGPAETRGSAGGSGSLDVQIELLVNELDPGPDAWSIGVGTEGCQIVAATTVGTVAADGFETQPGLRDTGFAHTEVTEGGGAVSAVVLSWLRPIRLPVGEAAAILALTVEGQLPASGCSECRVFVDDGQRGTGQPVTNVVSIDGWSYPPSREDSVFQLCAD
jgi:hypothetical protein